MINYFTVANKNIEHLTCSYCAGRNDSYIMYTYDIKIISRRNDCKYFVTYEKNKICNMCYNNINKESGRVLEISNNFYNRFITKNEQFLKTTAFLKSMYNVQIKRTLSVFSEIYIIGETRFETRAISSTGFYSIEEYQEQLQQNVGLMNASERTIRFRQSRQTTINNDTSQQRYGPGHTTNSSYAEETLEGPVGTTLSGVTRTVGGGWVGTAQTLNDNNIINAWDDLNLS